MKVFISWSGSLSHHVAKLLAEWIECVLQGTKVWLSSNDIEKGSVWFNALTSQLEETKLGILCITHENQRAPWVLFEAGSLCKGLDRSRVCPLLINLSHSDLQPPLSAFNGTLPNREDMRKLLDTINNQATTALPAAVLERTFDKWWGDFERRFAEIIRCNPPEEAPKPRPTEEMIAEILEIVRTLQRSSQGGLGRGGGSGSSLLGLLSPELGFTSTAQRLDAKAIGLASELEIGRLGKLDAASLRMLSESGALRESELLKLVDPTALLARKIASADTRKPGILDASRPDQST